MCCPAAVPQDVDASEWFLNGSEDILERLVDDIENMVRRVGHANTRTERDIDVDALLPYMVDRGQQVASTHFKLSQAQTKGLDARIIVLRSQS